MKIRKRELARAGIFGSIDNPVVVKETELEEIAETFADVRKAPIKLGGHWTENRPRLGNVISVTYDKKTKTLSGEVEEQDALSEAVDEGYYPDVSIGAKQRASDGKMYLHHLAYLGDEPPQVKDLEKGLAEALTESERKIAAADEKDVRLYPSLSEKQLRLSDPSEPESGNEKNKTDPVSAPPSEKAAGTGTDPNGGLSMTEEEIKVMKAENERLKAENESKEKMLSDSMAAARERDKEALRKAAEGKVTQPQMESLMALCDSFRDGKTVELSDSDGKKKTESPISVLTGIFASMKPKVEEGALNLSDSEPSSNKKSLAARMMGNV
jgi:hypothetical protein